MGNYNVVFKGEISNGFVFADVIENLAALFKIDVEKADRLFSKPQVVLKKGVDYESAQKYRQALLKKTGAICDVKEIVAASNPLPTNEAAPPNPTVQALQQQVSPAGSQQSAYRAPENTADIDISASDKQSSEDKSTSWLGDMIGGGVLIGIGFTFGGSIFLGNPGPLDYFFDCFGIFWIGRGLYKLVLGK